MEPQQKHDFNNDQLLEEISTINFTWFLLLLASGFPFAVIIAFCRAQKT